MTSPANNQDKQAWCDAFGAPTERKFVRWAVDTLGLKLRMNDAKADDPYTFDMYLGSWPADLKSVRTPFYMASALFGLDPQYTVTFNHKDGLRYREKYPTIRVIFDVMFDGKRHRMGVVQPMRLVAVGTLDGVATAIRDSGLHKHPYRERVNDTSGNAKESWLLDVRRLTVLYERDPN